MDLKEIKKNIDLWKRIKDTEEGYKLITSGPGFEIHKKQYEAFLKPKSVSNYFVYLGVENSELVFYTMPQEIKNIKDEEDIIVSKLTTSKKMLSKSPSVLEFNLEDRLSLKESFKRLIKWMVGSRDWFNKNSNRKAIVEFFEVPSKDFNILFSNEETEKTFLFFAINPNTIKGHSDFIELILCNENKKESIKDNLICEDITKPCPPFSF